MTKNLEVQKELNGIARKFENIKKYNPAQCVDELVDAMSGIGGITGLKVASYQTLSLHNHTATYNFPIVFEEHKNNLSKFGKKVYGMFEGLVDHLKSEGLDKSHFQYHLGKDYASKHHDAKIY